MTSSGNAEPGPSEWREPPGASHDDLGAPHTRISTAWTLVGIGALLLLLMLVFIFQNSADVPLKFLWLEGNVPLGAAMLLAAVIGALAVVSLGAGRLLQLRLAARRHRRAAQASPPSNA